MNGDMKSRIAARENEKSEPIGTIGEGGNQ